MSHPKIGILGTGMVGSALARYFSEIKNYKRNSDLFLYDTDTGKNHFDDINNADVIFICVPTPRLPGDGSADISRVTESIKKIKPGKIVVIKSTVPPGTTEFFQERHQDLKLLFNPEFLTESRAWEDMVRPDRQIVGFTAKSLEAAYLVLSLLPKAPLMSPWGRGTYAPVRITATEAELIKYAGNIHFVRKVNWANALAKAAEKLGIDYENVRQGMAADHRIGDSHLDVSHGGYRGWGGACFPKDTAAFIAWAKERGLNDIQELLSADWHFNEELLAEQGLTFNDVNRHGHEINLPGRVTKKRVNL